MSIVHRITERAGDVAGSIVAPAFQLVSKLRKSKTFHPRGDVFSVEVDVHPEAEGSNRELGERLEGKGAIRFSDALTQGKARWPDVLGAALKLGPGKGGAMQHLLFATIKRPWTMPLSPFTTHVRDYLENDYYAVSPFAMENGRTVYVRLKSEHKKAKHAIDAIDAAEARRAKLEADCAEGNAKLALEVAPGPRGPFRPVARIRITRLLEKDALLPSFDPFVCERGLTPVGFIHAMRKAVYSASREGRESTREELPERASA